jgi:hypothetical protein
MLTSRTTQNVAKPIGLLHRLLRASRRLRSSLLLLGTLVAWGVCSLVEFNASIFLAALAMFVVGLVIARLIDRRGGAAVALFSIAYLVRSSFALIAYYSGKGEAYWVGGAGSDAIAYYNTSFLDLGEALFEFTYKGFVTYNTTVTHWALRFDDAHYLCNLQGPVVAGALLCALSYAVIRELRDESTAYAVALILALHPSLITISSILLRDSLVGVFGWATMLLIIRLFQVRSFVAALLHLALLAGTVLILSYLRLQSLLVFVGLSLVALWFTTRQTPDHRGLPAPVRRAAVIAVGVLAVGGVVLLLAGQMPVGLDSKYFQSVVEYRLENAAQGSLGVALSSANLPLATLMYTLLAMITPFPFYAWSPDVLGHPTAPLDYLTGMGGLVNQLLLAVAIVGFIRAVRTRDAMTLAWVVSIVGFVALTILGGGDTVRYIAVHVFALYLMMAVDGMRVVRRKPGLLVTWAGVIVALYVMYETLKSAMGQNYVLLSLGIFVMYFATYLYRAWSVTSRHGAIGVMARPNADAVTPLVPA